MLPGIRVFSWCSSAIKRASKLLPALAFSGLFSASQAAVWGQVSSPSPFDFGAVPAGSSVTHPITFSFTRSATISSLSVVTQGVSGKDFQLQTGGPSSNLCAGHSFQAGDTCTVKAAFSPLAPGLRIGEVQLLSGSGNPVATAYISGWGLGAMLVSGTPAIHTVAGIDNNPGYNYDAATNAAATSNQLNAPLGVVGDLDGNIYFADWKNRIIRKVTPTGTINTVAGVQGQSPSGCQALVNAPALTTPAFDQPGGGMAIDAAGNLIVGDYGLHCVYSVNLKDETITTILGQGGSGGEEGDDSGSENGAGLAPVGGIGIDGAGNVYVGTSGSVLKLDPSNHLTTVAGKKIAGPFSGEGGPATSATISIPYTIIFDAAGELIFTDSANGRVLKIDSSGDIHTILGGGTVSTSSLPAFGYPGSTQGTSVNTGELWGVAADGPGNLYATATEHGEIIALDSNGYAYVYSGTQPGTPFGTSADSGDGGVPGSATLSSPSGLWVAANGDMLVADEYGDDVRRIGYTALSETSLSFAATEIGHKSSDSPQSATLVNIGTAPLTYATPSTGTNPMISSSFAVDVASTCQQPSAAPSFSLALGASCVYAVDFLPVRSGPINGALTISGNIFGGAASIALSGAGVRVADKFVVTAPPAAVAGTPITVNVTAYFQDSVATNFTGTLTIRSSDGKAILPTQVNLVAGVGSFSATLETVGIQTITATDVSGVSGTSNNIAVSAASPHQVVAVSGSAQSTIIGSEFPAPLKVEVLDAYGNSVAGATVIFAAPSTGASATLSAPTCSTSATTPAGYCSVVATANGNTSSTAYNVSASAGGVGTSATFSLTNLQAPTTLTLTPSAASLVYGQPAALAAVISPSSAGGSVPTGTVMFSDGPNVLSPSISVNGAAASYPVSVPVVGTHTYTGKYSGDLNFGSSVTAGPSTVIVNKARANVAGPAAQPVTLPYAQGGSIPLTITGQYSGPGIASPSGTVTYTILNASNASAGSGTLAIASGGVSVPVAATLVPGAYTIEASYSGDSNYLASTTATVTTVQIGQIQPLIRWATPPSITYGTALTGLLNATALNGTSIVPGNYGYSAGAVPVTESSVLPPGTYTVSVSFTPTDTTMYLSASGSVSLVVNKALPGVSLTSSASPVLLKNPTIFTATVSSNVSTPTGTVTFLDGTTAIGMAPVVNGLASLSVSSLAAGAHSIIATYSGDGNFLVASSSPLTQHVDDFAITAGSSISYTILPGGLATYQFTLSPMGDVTFPANISLSMDGQPTNAAITFDPSGVNAGSGTTNFTVTVATPSLSGSAHAGPSFGKCAGSLALALLLLPFSRRLRRQARKLGRLGAMLLILAAGTVLVGTTGCGARTGYFATPQHTYTLTVTGASGALAHSASVTLTVE